MISQEQFNNEIELIIANAIKEDVGEAIIVLWLVF